MKHISLDSEFQEILAIYPSASYLELLSRARERGWNLEKLSPDQEACAAKISAKQALLILKAQNNFLANRPSRFEQIIPTGFCYGHKAAVSEEDVERLKLIYNARVLAQDSSPMSLSEIIDNEGLDVRDLLVKLVKSVLAGILHDEEPKNAARDSSGYVILMNRCLLRRTYSSLAARPMVKNQNNQQWHQDSNTIFQDRPMLTLWIPLHEGSGSSIPGIEIAQIAAERFIPGLGDGVENLEEIFKETITINHNTDVASADAGDCIAFNGLTFHRTYTATQMKGFRDALLVRCCPVEHSRFFPGNRSNDLFINVSLS